PGPPAQHDLVVRRLPRSGRRQVPRLRRAAGAGAPGPAACAGGPRDHRPRDRDLRAARVDGADRRVAQRRGAHAWQGQDHGADDRDPVPALPRHAVRPGRHAAVGHLADLRIGGADDLVDGVLPAEGAAGDPSQGSMSTVGARDRLVQAMPPVFVLIWSTGFIVARYGMPYAPPISFLSLRYALSVLSFGVWIALSRAAWPRGRAQWLHLAVSGVL